jgi:uncharacterized repeat protein (TIGR01451 family)
MDSQGNLIMSKDDITRWIATHGDWLLAGPASGSNCDIIQQAHPGIPIDVYREWHYVNVFYGDDHYIPITYTGVYYPSRVMYFESRLSQSGKNPEDMYLHVGYDTYWSNQQYRLFLDMWGLVFYWSPSDKFWITRDKIYRGNTSEVLSVPGTTGYVAFGCIYPTDEIQLEFATPNQGGQFVLEYSSGVDPNTWEITSWSPVPILEDTTNGFTQDGRIRWNPNLSGWVRGRLPGTTVSEYRSACYFIRIRCISSPTTTMRIKGTRTSSWLQYYPSIRASGHAIYIGSRTAFTSTALSFLTPGVGGSYVVEYPTSVDGSGYATGWTAVSNLVDGTSGLSQNGTMSWDSPTGWAQAHLSFSYAPKLYWIRIRATSTPSTYPVLREAAIGGVSVPNQHLYGDRYTIMIPGWDSANDRNGDGWVDDTEYAVLLNPNCHARTRYQSRAVRFGWLNTTTLELNWGLPGLKEMAADYYSAVELGSPYATGLYCDSQTYTGCPYPTVEYPDPSQRLWVRDWNYAFSHIRTTGKRVGGNTSAGFVYAPKQDDSWLAGTGYFTGVYNDFLNREGFLHGFLDFNIWTNLILLDSALAHGAGVVQMFQSNFSSTLSSALSATTTATGWKRFQEHSVAVFYLIQHPTLSYLNISHGYSYGTAIIDTPIGRMPKPMAHQPTALLSVDIGVPANTIPPGYSPMGMTYTPAWGQPTYTVGDTASTSVAPGVPYIGGKPLYPTHVFVLARGTNPNTGKSFSILARKYTKGLVLVKVVWSSYTSADVGDGSLTTHDLPGTYRRVNWDGTLGEPITQISLRGMEGAILVDTSATSQPSVHLVMSVDKPNPKPLDVVTVTITATNTGNAEARNVRITHDIPQGATYVLGSLKLDGNALPDPTDTTKIDVTVASIPVGGQAVVEFQMVIR